MNRSIFAALALLLAFPAFPATTWTTDTSRDTSTVRVSVATCTTGSESAPADGIGVAPNEKGLDLYGIKGFVVQASAAAAMTAGGVLQAYIYNPITTKWHRVRELDLVVGNLQYETFSGFTVTSDWSRILFVPVGVGQAVTIYVVGRKLPPGWK